MLNKHPSIQSLFIAVDSLGNKISDNSSDKFPTKIIFDETKHLTKIEWDKFENIILSCSFWTLPPIINIFGYDGSEWILEGHLENKYWFVARWSPIDKFASCGNYLINLSGLKEKIY